MKQEKTREPLTVGPKTKQVYCSVSQYSSTHHIFTKVKYLLKWRNNTHTAPPRTNNKLNANKDKQCTCNPEARSDNYSCEKRD